MGRKLSPGEAEVFKKDTASLRGEEAEVSLSSNASTLQSRIAEALGISVADLHQRSAFENNVQEVSHDAQTAKMALTRECLDLMEAFVRVADPEERQRLLKVVRDAAFKQAPNAL